MTDDNVDLKLAFTAANSQSAADFGSVLTSYLGSRTDTMSLLDIMLQADAAMPMAVCLRGYLLKLAAHPKFTGAIAGCIERAQTLIEQHGGNPRELAHVEALRHWHEDRADTALRVLEGIVRQYPLDMLALRIAHYLHFYNSGGQAMRNSTARVLEAWQQDHPHYGYLLGMHAFGLEESGDYDAALEFGQAAVARNEADVWATHAVTHVYLMQERHEEGIAWLGALRAHWRDTNNFRYHVIWHEALHWLGLGAPERALAIYDDSLAGSVDDDFYLDVCNNASLLWRLEFAGVDVGARWHELADTATRHVEDRELVFASLHYLIPLAVTRQVSAETLLETLRGWADSGTDQGKVCSQVGVALANAIVKSQSEPENTCNLLQRSQPSTYLIGGSNAQRDLFAQLAAATARNLQTPFAS